MMKKKKSKLVPLVDESGKDSLLEGISFTFFTKYNLIQF